MLTCKVSFGLFADSRRIALAGFRSFNSSSLLASPSSPRPSSQSSPRCHRRGAPGGKIAACARGSLVHISAQTPFFNYKSAGLSVNLPIHNFAVAESGRHLESELYGLSLSPLERLVDDGVAVIEWIAEQSWCNGKVGTMGISWGGITGLQLAQRAPEALKTIILLGATDQRDYDDAGYYLGCLVGQTLGWAAIMFGYNTRPPDPQLAGENWRDLWLEHLEQTPHYFERWLEHQHNDKYWKNNSVDTDYAAIKIPVTRLAGTPIAGLIPFPD